MKQTTCLLLAVLLMAACAPGAMPGVTPTEVRVSIQDYASLVEAFKAQGVAAQPGEEIDDPVFAIKGRAVNLPNARLQVIEYATEAQAQAVAATITPDGFGVGNAQVEWVEPPHFYRANRMIVLYFGQDEATLALLPRVLGPQFAGYVPPPASPTSGPRPSLPPPPTAPPVAQPHNPGVADLLRNPPPAGTTVEVDAYFTNAGSFHSGPPPPRDRVVCPLRIDALLTDRPFTAMLHVLNSTLGNTPPENSAWLIAVTPENKTPGRRIVPQLPYHARLRGQLGDPAFAGCDSAARIFMVESVVKVYEQDPPVQPGWGMKLPEDYASWPRYHDARFGYSLPYPHDWQVERLDDVTLKLSGGEWTKYPVTVAVHPGETHPDPYDWSAVPPLLRGNSWGVFRQGWTFGENGPQTQNLDGYEVMPSAQSGQGATAVLLSGSGHTYELALRYPTGFDASQPLLTIYTAIVEGFRLDVSPGPSPTPPVKQNLGPGSFLTREQALARVRAQNGTDAELLQARLVSEAEARKECGVPCDFEGHPEGVWVMHVRGTFEGATRTMLLFVDAATGKQLGGEEIDPNAPSPEPDHPGVTDTPVGTMPSVVPPAEAPLPTATPAPG